MRILGKKETTNSSPEIRSHKDNNQVRIKKDILSLVFQVRLILTFSFGYKASLEISRSMVGGGGERGDKEGHSAGNNQEEKRNN